MKKFLAFVLSLAMLLSLVTVPVWAEEPAGEYNGPLVGKERYQHLFTPNVEATGTIDSAEYSSSSGGITENQLWVEGTTNITDTRNKNLYFGTGSTKDNPTIVWISGTVTVAPKIQIPYGLNESNNAYVIFVGLENSAKLILEGGMTLVTQDGQEAQDNSQPFVAFAGNLELAVSGNGAIKANYVVMADGATLKIGNNTYTDIEGDNQCTFLDIDTTNTAYATQLRTTGKYSMLLAKDSQIRFESVQIEKGDNPYGGTKPRVIENTGTQDLTVSRLQNSNGQVIVEPNESFKITSRDLTNGITIKNASSEKTADIRFARRYLWLQDGTVTIEEPVADREFQVQVPNTTGESDRVFVSFKGENSIALTNDANDPNVTKTKMEVTDGSEVKLEKGINADANAVDHAFYSGPYWTKGDTTFEFDANANMYVMSGAASFGVQNVDPNEKTGIIFGGGTGAQITNDASNTPGTKVTVAGDSAAKTDIITVPNGAAITVKEKDAADAAAKHYSNPSGGDINITLSDTESPLLSSGGSVSLDSAGTDISVDDIYVVNVGETGSVEVASKADDIPVKVTVGEGDVAKIILNEDEKVIIGGITYTGKENGTEITVTGAKDNIYIVDNAPQKGKGEAFASGTEDNDAEQNKVSITSTSGIVEVGFATANQTIKLTDEFTATDVKTDSKLTGSGLYLQAGHNNVTATITKVDGGISVIGDPGLKALYGQETLPPYLTPMAEGVLEGYLITELYYGITVKVTDGTASWGDVSGQTEGAIAVRGGEDSPEITFAANSGNALESVTIDDKRIPVKDFDTTLVNGKYSFGEMTADHSIVVVYSTDTIGGTDGNPGDNIPDNYQVTVTYKVVGGYWNGDTNDATNQTQTVTLMKDGFYDNENGTTTETLTPPAVGANPDDGHEPSGGWDTDPASVIINAQDKDDPPVYTYTYDEPGSVTINYRSSNIFHGTVTTSKETVCASDAIQGSTAQPKSGYKFVHWEKASVPGVPVSTEEHFVPPVNDDGLPDAETYIAVFEVQTQTLYYYVEYYKDNTLDGARETVTDNTHPELETVTELNVQSGTVNITDKFTGWTFDHLTVDDGGSQKTLPETVPVNAVIKVYYVKDETGSDPGGDPADPGGSTDDDNPGGGSTDDDNPGGGSTDSDNPGGGSTDSDTPGTGDPGSGSTGTGSGVHRPSTPQAVLDTEEHYAYVIGSPDGKINPDSSITRAEIVTILFRLLTDEARETYWGSAGDPENGIVFADVTENDWFNHAVYTLVNLGILEGSEGADGLRYFKPGDLITRAEVATMVVRFYDIEEVFDPERDGAFKDVDEGAWYEKFVNLAQWLGLVEGNDGLFRPTDNMTRAEAMTIFNRLLARHPDVHGFEDVKDKLIQWPDLDPKSWYYLQVVEATNSHKCDETTQNGKTIHKVTLTANRDWAQLEKND